MVHIISMSLYGYIQFNNLYVIDVCTQRYQFYTQSN